MPCLVYAQVPIDPALAGIPAQVLAKIDPSIQGPERALLGRFMTGLRAKNQENYILITQDGKVHANKPKLISVLGFPTSLGGGVYADSHGNQFVLPLSAPKPNAKPIAKKSAFRPLTQSSPRFTFASFGGFHLLTPQIDVYAPAFYEGSGPYRQVFSKVPSSDVDAGYSDIAANVYLPSGANGEISENPNGVTDTSDSCSIYMGGWGAGSAPDAVDAGFTHDHSSANPDAWTMILSSSRYGSLNPKVGDSSNPPGGVVTADAIRFNSGQSVFLEFFAAPDGNGGSQIDVAATGDAYDQTQPSHPDLGTATYTIAIDTGTNSGWNVNGNGVVLKRNTSIGQQIVPKPAPGQPSTCDNFHTGSFIKNVSWTNCQIGVYNSSGILHNWSSADTNYVPGSYPNDDPPAGSGATYSNIIQTQYLSGSNSNDPASEVDNIIMLPN